MALHFDLRNVADHEKIDAEGLNGVATAMIYATMIVGMGTITADNWQRFAARISFAQRVHGPFLSVKDAAGNTADALLTDEHVKRFIGLKCNVTEESPAKWLSRFLSLERSRM